MEYDEEILEKCLPKYVGDITEEQCDYFFRNYIYGGLVW